jgi:hypothetical protein
MFLQISVDGALAAQPRKSTFCFMTQLDIPNIASAALSLFLALDGDLDQVSTRTSPNVHAASGDKVRLVARVTAEDAEDSCHVGIIHLLLVAGEKTRNVTASHAGFTDEVRLLEFVSFSDAFQGRAEIAHKFFCRACPILWELRFNAMNC